MKLSIPRAVSTTKYLRCTPFSSAAVRRNELFRLGPDGFPEFLHAGDGLAVAPVVQRVGLAGGGAEALDVVARQADLDARLAARVPTGEGVKRLRADPDGLEATIAHATGGRIADGQEHRMLAQPRGERAKILDQPQNGVLRADRVVARRSARSSVRETAASRGGWRPRGTSMGLPKGHASARNSVENSSNSFRADSVAPAPWTRSRQTLPAVAAAGASPQAPGGQTAEAGEPQGQALLRVQWTAHRNRFYSICTPKELPRAQNGNGNGRGLLACDLGDS